MTKKTVKVILKMNQLTPKTNLYNAQLLINGNMGLEDIVKEMLVEHPFLEPDLVATIIDAFNQKTVQLLQNGFTINNGLTTIRPALNDSLNSKIWNPRINPICLNFSEGMVVKDAMMQMNIELEEEISATIEVPACSPREKLSKCETHSNTVTINQKENLAGVSAFRSWLMKS
jgi:hypothetical protein